MAQSKQHSQTDKKSYRSKRGEKNGEFEQLCSFRNITSFFQQLEKDPYSLRFSLDAGREQNRKKDRRKRKKTGKTMLDSHKVSENSGKSGHSLLKKRSQKRQQDRQLKTVFRSQGNLPTSQSLQYAAIKLKSLQNIKPLLNSDDSLPKLKSQFEKEKNTKYKKKKKICSPIKVIQMKRKPSESVKLTDRQIHRLQKIFEIEQIVKINQEKAKTKNIQLAKRR